MQRLSQAEAERLMSLYTPEELAAFDRRFHPERYRKSEPRELSHAEMLAERAERSRRWHAEDAAALAAAEARRTPEAVCRGNSAPHQPGDELTPAGVAHVAQLPGDHLAATRAWVRYHFAGMRAFDGIEESAALNDGYSREVWRAAAAALLTTPKDAVLCPRAYLLQCVNGLAAGEQHDVRARLSFAPSDSWPDLLFAFANVPAPARSRR